MLRTYIRIDRAELIGSFRKTGVNFTLGCLVSSNLTFFMDLAATVALIFVCTAVGVITGDTTGFVSILRFVVRCFLRSLTSRRR